MPSNSAANAKVSERLQTATNELRKIEELLTSERLDSSVLTDFRDAVNRVRTTAWAVAQVLESGTAGTQSPEVLSLLSNERVRVAYRLCRLIAGDLANGAIGSGKLVPLYLATQDLAKQIGQTLGRDDAPTQPTPVDSASAK